MNDQTPTNDLLEQAAALVTGWRTRRVPREAWYQAETLILRALPHDRERARAALETLAHQYAHWQTLTGDRGYRDGSEGK